MFSISKFFNRTACLAQDTKMRANITKNIDTEKTIDTFVKTATKEKSKIKQQPPFEIIKNALKLSPDKRVEAGIGTFVDTENNILASLYHQALKAGCTTKEALQNAKITTLATGHYSTGNARMSYDTFAKNGMI